MCRGEQEWQLLRKEPLKKRNLGFTNTPKGDSGGALTVEDGVLAGLVSRGGSEDCGTVSKDCKKTWFSS